MRELRNIRLRRGLSQADLSAITGVAEYTISEIEAGKRPSPRPSTLRKLAHGLGVEVADLYGEPAYPKAEAPPSAEQRSFNHLLEEERRASQELPFKVLLENLITRGEGLEEELKSAVDYYPIYDVYMFGTDSFALRRLVRSGPVSAQIREAWEAVDALGMRIEGLLQQLEGDTLTPEQQKQVDMFKRLRTEEQADVDLAEEANYGNASADAG